MNMREEGGNVMREKQVWLPLVGLFVALTLFLAACGAAPSDFEMDLSPAD